MSKRLKVLDRMMQVARKLEATELYAALADGEEFDWSDPIHVRPDRAPQRLRVWAEKEFEKIAKQTLPGGKAIAVEGAPNQMYCLTVPVWIENTRSAIGCFIVQADARMAYFMLELAILMLKEPRKSDPASSG